MTLILLSVHSRPPNGFLYYFVLRINNEFVLFVGIWMLAEEYTEWDPEIN